MIGAFRAPSVVGLSWAQMERARATWTDERLDDLSRRVDAGFDRIDHDLRGLRAEMNLRFEAVESKLGGRMDNLQRTMTLTIIAVMGTFVSALASLVAVLIGA